MVCPLGHQWDLEQDATPPATGLVCLFCGSPCRPAADTDERPAQITLPLAEGGPASVPTIWLTRAGHDTADAPANHALDRPPDPPGYRVLHRLGRGGMGEVYLALQSGTGRLVALKTPRLGAALVELTRFRAEAELLARLQHPGIVPVYEVGAAAGRLFLAMEYCPGGSLADKLDGTPLPPRPAANLTEALAQAVHAAHRAGVIHRDLKPGNVLLSPRADAPTPAPDALDLDACVPKVSDFGLARWIDDDRGLTQTGAVLGTPAYMAPEQAFGEARRVGPAADVYALGVILYELLTGRPPFQGATALDTLDQLRTHDPVPPARLQPTIPRDLDTICLKCLHKEPARRYPSADALADDLRRFLDGRPVLARPVGPGERFVKWVRRNPRVAALAGLLVVAVAAGLVGMAVYQRRLAAQRDRAVSHLRVALRSVDGLLTGVAEEDLAAEPRAEGKRRVLLEKALALCQELARIEGDDPTLREQVALAARRVGDIQRQLGSYPEARAAYHQARLQFLPLSAAAPERSDLLRHVADCHNFTGEVDRLTARPREAADEYRQARDLQQRVADAEPGNTEVRYELARSRYNLGLVYRDTGQLPSARTELEEAAALLRGFSADDIERRRHLARALLNLGAVLRLLGESGPAQSASAEAVALYEGLMKQVPGRPEFRHELAKAFINRANIRQKDHDPDATAKLLLRARELLARLADDFPQTPEFRGDLATACNGLAAGAFERRDRADAERWLIESADAWRKVLATHPAVPDYHAGLGMALGNLGRVRLGRGDGPPLATIVGAAAVSARGEGFDPAAVAAALEEGIRELIAALRANPDQPECRASLRQQCADVAKLAARTGDTGLAIRVADSLAAGLPTGAVGPAYAAFLLARVAATAGDRPGIAGVCADHAFGLLNGCPAAELTAHEKLLADPAFDGFRADDRFARLLPQREAKSPM
ncbi:MAG: pknB 4 [Gemmataceae bacterium]|nr:pknB 4 [Gemmataceae bacterium]